MPPETPRTIRLGTTPLRACSPSGFARVGGGGLGRGLLGGQLGRVDVLAGQQVFVDLAQRDRERLLLDVGVDERADVLQEALAELGVVGVDLPGALGAVEHQLVLAVAAREQLVDRRVGHAFGGGVGSGHASAHSCVMVEDEISGGQLLPDASPWTIKATNSSAAA